ncbi:MAG TPA: UvrD-helicase domain-containing protein, partial [Gemmataceae bacterium]
MIREEPLSPPPDAAPEPVPESAPPTPGGLTEQQRRAVGQRGVSVLLASGAGCGKTHVLTARYLSHLTEDAAGVGEVVAITFTERAAREMRERIRRAVVERLRQAADEDTAARWAAHLRGLESAPITTIHAFCGNLLRQFAVPAGLDPRFEILEDVLASNLRSEALGSTLRALLTRDSQAGEDLRELVVLYGWSATVAAVEHLAASADLAAWEGWLAEPPEKVAERWLGQDRRDVLREWVEYLTAASPKVAGCLDLLRRVPCSGPQTRANVQRLLEETPRLAEAPDLAAAVEALKECAKVGKERGSAWPDEAAYALVKEAFEGFRKELPEKLALFTDDPGDVTDAARWGRRFLRVAAEVAGAYQERKRRAGVVDFQDLLVLARDLLRDRAEVRDALRDRYRFILVDELQDTDPVQMELIDLLCGKTLHFGKLFAVGDHKQSIYRFRGADVELFQALRRDVPREGRLGLTLNFRSQPGILHFVNALCAKRLPEYEPLQAFHPTVSREPCVEFLWGVAPQPPLSPEGRGGQGDASPQPSPTLGEETSSGPARESAADLRRREADAIARRLAQMLDRGEERVWDADRGCLRPVRPGDVVLLFRSMSHVAHYEAALRRHGLDYYLVGGRAFFAQQEIYDLLNLLRALENPHDAVSLAGTLRAPFCCLSDEALFVLGRHREGLWHGLFDPERFTLLPEEQKPVVERARRFLTRWRRLKDRLPISRLLGEVFADCGYDAAMLFEFLGERKLANLWKLQELARAFDRTGRFGLAEFIARLGELVRTQPREEQAATLPENADVVKLMSIHQAKGLEFPVVVVPDLNAPSRGEQLPAAAWDRRLGCLARPPSDEDPPPFSDFPWRLGRSAATVADWREDLRILYVACTRARDLLILSAGLPADVSPTAPAIKPASHLMLALAERFDLATGDFRGDDVPEAEVPEVRVVWAEPAGDVPRRARPDDTLGWEEEPEDEPVDSPAVPAFVSLPALERAVRRRGERATLSLFGQDEEEAPPPQSMIELSPPLGNRARGRWMSPRERLGAFGGDEWGRAEALFWEVLGRWDLTDADGWPMLLAELCDEPAVAERAKGMLRTFAESEQRRRLAGAAACLRDVEFVMDCKVFQSPVSRGTGGDGDFSPLSPR